MTDNPAVIATIEGRAIPVRGNDIDTDRIIPARFLRSVTFDGLGEQAFRDERFNEDGTQKEHSFNDSRYGGASILIVNRNFGCGSSREHAPQALMRFGIKAIIGESFGEIFAGNCVSIGVPVLTADETILEELQRRVEQESELEMRLDIESETLECNGKTYQLSINPAPKTALLAGTWNTLDELLVNRDQIDAVYQRLDYVSNFS